MRYIDLEHHPSDGRIRKCFDSSRRHGYEELINVCCTVESFWGTGGGNVPLILVIYDEDTDREKVL